MNKIHLKSQGRVSVFSNFFQLKPAYNITISQALEAIRTGFLWNNDEYQGYTPVNNKVNKARAAGKKTNRTEYDKWKGSTECFTWSTKFKHHSYRKEDCGNREFSGAIYFDVDTFLEGQTLEQAKLDIMTIPCVKAVWKSLSGSGLGGIIYAEGNTLGYFLKVQELLKEKNYTIDVAAKDLSSRMNVCSYDVDVAIRADEDVILLTEPIEVIERTTTTNKATIASKSNTTLATESLVDVDSKCKMAFDIAESKFNYIQGQRNQYVVFFCGLTNSLGIAFEDMKEWILSKYSDFDTTKANNIYKRYASQFGSKIEEVVPADNTIITDFDKNKHLKALSKALITSDKLRQTALDNEVLSGKDLTDEENAANTVVFKEAFEKRYISLALFYGLDLNKLASLITEEYTKFNLEAASEYYARFKKFFNSNKSGEFAVSKMNVVRTIVTDKARLAEIEELKAEDVLGRVLVSQTGSGKTYFVSKVLTEITKVIMICPQKSMVEEFSQSYNGAAYYEDKQEGDASDRLIFVTRNSLKNLLKRFTKVEINEYTLVLDESDAQVTDGSLDYCHQPVTDVSDIFSKHPLLKRVGLTATYLTDTDKTFNDMEVIKVEKDVQVDRTWSLVASVDRQNTLVKLAKLAKAKKGFLTIFINNTGTPREDIVSTMKSQKLIYKVFDASKKDEDYYKDLMRTGEIPADWDGIITTSVIARGNSFKLNTNRREVSMLASIGEISAELNHQMSGRMRNAKKFEVLQLKSESFESDDVLSFDEDAYRNELLEYANEDAIDANRKTARRKRFDELITDESFKKRLGFGSPYIKPDVDNDLWIIDIAIINYLHSLERIKMQNRNSKFLEMCIEPLGYTLTTLQHENTELDSIIKAAIKKDVKSVQQRKRAVLQTFIDSIRNSELGVLQNSMCIQDAKRLRELNSNGAKRNAQEEDIRFRIDYIYRHLRVNADESLDIHNEVFKIYDEVNSNANWKAFIYQVTVLKVLSDSKMIGTDVRSFLELIKAGLVVGKKYSMLDLNDLFTAAATLTDVKLDAHNSKAKSLMMLSLIKALYNVDRMQKRKDNARCYVYKIESIADCFVTIDVDSVNKTRERDETYVLPF